jgi:hypothetical protein
MSTEYEMHTPGNWTVKDNGGPNAQIQSDTSESAMAINQRGVDIAEVWNAGPECLQEDARMEALANARLMAASKEMFAALKAAEQFLASIPNSKLHRGHTNAYGLIITALARAGDSE